MKKILTLPAIKKRKFPKGEWHEIGERKIYFRSKWELQCALALESYKRLHWIKEWKYEPRLFKFDAISHGTTVYKPDFEVTKSDGEKIYVEVKGYKDPKSETKIKRFRKYYPQFHLEVLDRKWFQHQNFRCPSILFVSKEELNEK